jgi:cation:H+ antiporter
VRRAITLIGIMMAIALPAIYCRISGAHVSIVTDTVIFGLAIVAAAFLLSWAAEIAEVDIPQGLAVAFIAFIAVLPEYAIDMTFAWKAGQDPEFAEFAVANMTGANRLLIGVGWSAVFVIFWIRTRGRVLHLHSNNALDVIALGTATLYSFILPFKGSISLFDSIVLFAIFAVYIYGISRSQGEEPELVGPSRWIGELSAIPRRTINLGLFVYAAIAILASAEPFAEGLIHTGTELGIDEFLLVQWLAPFASEAPEFLVAGILAFRGRAMVGMAALLSSKVNQWTLLLGGIPIAFSLSGETLNGLPLDSRQSGEVFLTAAQSLFAVTILLSLSLSRIAVASLIGLFTIQFLIPISEVRIVISIIYITLALATLWRQRQQFLNCLRITRAMLGQRKRKPEGQGGTL